MTDHPRLRCARCAAAVVAALCVVCSPAHAQDAEYYKGRSLIDALRTLQAKGLRIVYTSATVTPDLLVALEPQATTARQQLDELLAPHGLASREAAGGIIQIVRAEREVREPRAAALGSIEGRVADVNTAAPLVGVLLRLNGVKGSSFTDAEGRFLLQRVPAGAQTLVASTPGYASATRAIQVVGGTTVAVIFSLSPATSTHKEYVAVSRPWPYRKDHGVASESSLDRTQFDRLYGSFGDDPIRAIHALPRVSPVDEFRSEFAVRGSPYRHAELVVDGVTTQWLRHTVHGRGATGSVAMFAAPALEDATLRAGAYPHRHGDHLGPQLELTLREGSRSRVALRGAVGGTHALLLGEGPLGRSQRGSWLVAVRQSYLEWPTEDAESTRAAFGFSDGLAKVVYDVRANHQVSMSVLGGTSNVDSDDHPTPNALGDGANRASVMSVSWRSGLGSSVVLSQRGYVVRQRFLNKQQTGEESDRGASEEIGYRADITRPIAGGLLEAGAQVARAAIDDVPRSAKTPAHAIEGASWRRSGYAHFAWDATPWLTISPGARVTMSTLVAHPTVTRWVLGEWAFRSGWTLTGSAGVSQQLPDLRHVLAGAGAIELRPERATHVDLAIEQRLSRSIRWQATVFSRTEEDILREPDIYPRLVDDAIVAPEPGKYVNALQGASRGIELLVGRRSPLGLSGWAVYSYGTVRYTDAARNETFWGDFDERHAVNLFGVYRFSTRASVGAAFRAGSGFPMPGYFAARDGSLFLGARRNEVRLPTHARLDVRSDRTFEYFGRPLTLFAEVVNVLNRGNVGIANGTVNPATGEVTGFTDRFRRRVSAGVVIQF